MKKIALMLMMIVLNLVSAGSVLGHEGEMTCPGHDDSTIASLQLCVSHMVAEGHITSQGVANSLLARLDAAQMAVDGGRAAAAVNILNSFINEVQAQAGIHIDSEHALHMIEHAQRVIAVLEG
jgi:hypothetical protein